jgi:hypothetical protein
MTSHALMAVSLWKRNPDQLFIYSMKVNIYIYIIFWTLKVKCTQYKICGQMTSKNARAMVFSKLGGGRTEIFSGVQKTWSFWTARIYLPGKVHFWWRTLIITYGTIRFWPLRMRPPRILHFKTTEMHQRYARTLECGWFSLWAAMVAFESLGRRFEEEVGALRKCWWASAHAGWCCRLIRCGATGRNICAFCCRNASMYVFANYVDNCSHQESR